MSEQQNQKGGKNKKHGRGKRSPSMQRYVSTNRCATNKTRKQARHIKRMEKHAAKVEARHRAGKP